MQRYRLTNLDHTIRGSGGIGYNPSTPTSNLFHSIVNHGVIRAEEAGRQSGLVLASEHGVTNHGVLESAPGAFLQWLNPLPSAPLVVNQAGAGELRINGGLSTTSVRVSGGKVTGTGSVDVSADAFGAVLRVSGAVLSPGREGQPFGTFTVRGNLALDDFATYHADLSASTQSDRLVVTGLLDLAGSGDSLSLAGGNVGTTYTIATFGTRGGEFDFVSESEPARDYIVVYDNPARQVRVTVVVPEPGGGILVAALPWMLSLPTSGGRRRRRARNPWP